MSIWYDFPYTNFHDQNMDFLLKLAVELKHAIDTGFANEINEWIDENYNTLFFNATYNPDTETITFSRNE